MVPEGWENVSVEDVCKQISVGIVIQPAQYYVADGKGIRAFRSANVREGKIEDSDWVYLSSEGQQKNKKSVLRTGDVLVVRSGYPGTACVVSEEYEGSNCIDIIFARPDQNEILPEYLCAFTNSDGGKRQVLGAQGGLAQKHLNVGAYKKLCLPLPPIHEQRRIARILSTWDKAIETVERLIENSKAQKKALMQKLLTGKRRLPRFTKDWRQHRLGDHCVFKGGVAFKEVYQGSTSGDFPFIKVSDMSLPRNEKFILIANNWVTDKVRAEIKAKPFPVGAVVFAKVGAALLLNRRRILVRETIIDNNMMAAMPKPSLDSEFLYQTMLMIDFAKFVQDGAVPSVNQADLLSTKLRLPELAEQQKISAVLSNADREIENRQLHLATLKQQKKALMQQLLTGKRRVRIDPGRPGEGRSLRLGRQYDAET